MASASALIAFLFIESFLLEGILEGMLFQLLARDILW